jgi:transposase
VPAFLQPILMPVKGTPDIVLSIDPKTPDELFVFLGMALLEKVPRAREHLAFKLLLARLSNAGMHSRRLTQTFGVARSTLRRWGRALKSGDLERVRKAFSGQGAEKKITPEIENYVRDRFRDLQGQCRDHNKVIRSEVLKYFKVSVSAERLRWIFKEERGALAHSAESEDGAQNGRGPRPAEPCPGANPCETALENSAGEGLLPPTRNYSLPPSGLLWSGRLVPEKPTLCHHAGLLLMSHWIDTLMAGWTLQPDLVRQWVGQVLLGAVNHEQSKRLSFSSLAWIIGPAIRSVNYQRQLLKELAEPDRVLALLKRNGRLLGLCEKSLFYFDPHAEEYTGVLKTLKGWSGGLHRVDKIINMDFIHTEDGEPCFVQHADNFYDMRARFFMCIKAFRNILDPVKRPLTWVADRGLYGLETLRRIVDEHEDHFITWEKDYQQDGWDEKATLQQFEHLKPRNQAEDLCCYRFRWQEHPWVREPRFQRLIVRAINPGGREIEVAVLTSDPARARPLVIQALFNRWIQENDFGYMDRHVGINELTSRAHDPYASLGGELDDRLVQSRAYRALRRELTLAESTFTRRLLKREKLRKTHAGQADLERTEREALNRQIQTLTERPEAVAEERDLKKHRKALERLVAKQAAHSAKRQKKQADLDRLIDDQDHEVAKAEGRLAESVREESRLQALIDEQYFRLDTRRKAFMDAIRLSCRNIFCKLALEFRPLYNNYRDDHVIVRELTRSAGIIQQREGLAHILLIPTMEFQPATRSIVQDFLARISQQINQHFASRSMPIKIQLLNEESNDLTIDQHGLRWVSSPP